MAIRKGYCIRCHTDDYKRRIFTVNSDAVKCYCPRCMAEYKPKDAINYYNHFIRALCKRADTSLYTAKMPETAYDRYGRILELEPDYVKALLGRLSSLFYLSTLRRSRFDDVMMMRDLDDDRYHLVGSHDDYFAFLRTANAALETYRERIFKKLTVKGYFYDMDCLKLYVLRLQELIDFKKMVQKELISIGNQLEAEMIDPQLKDFEERLNHNTYVTVDGYSHKFKKFADHGVIQFVDSQDSVDVSLSNYKPFTLEENEKKTPIIKDNIFRSNKAAYSLTVVALVLAFVFGGLSTGLLISAIFPGGNMSIWLAILGGVAALIGGVLFLWQFLFKKILAKRSF